MKIGSFRQDESASQKISGCSYSFFAVFTSVISHGIGGKTAAAESVIKSAPLAVLGKGILSRLPVAPKSGFTISLFREGANRKTQLLLFTPRDN
ncbi:MAG TPA: hypothetical protein VF430_02940, partial [Verrucomicrobiae bacterium]